MGTLTVMAMAMLMVIVMVLGMVIGIIAVVGMGMSTSMAVVIVTLIVVVTFMAIIMVSGIVTATGHDCMVPPDTTAWCNWPRLYGAVSVIVTAMEPDTLINMGNALAICMYAYGQDRGRRPHHNHAVRIGVGGLSLQPYRLCRGACQYLEDHQHPSLVKSHLGTDPYSASLPLWRISARARSVLVFILIFILVGWDDFVI